VEPYCFTGQIEVHVYVVLSPYVVNGQTVIHKLFDGCK